MRKKKLKENNVFLFLTQCLLLVNGEKKLFLLDPTEINSSHSPSCPRALETRGGGGGGGAQPTSHTRCYSVHPHYSRPLSFLSPSPMGRIIVFPLLPIPKWHTQYPQVGAPILVHYSLSPHMWEREGKRLACSAHSHNLSRNNCAPLV